MILWFVKTFACFRLVVVVWPILLVWNGVFLVISFLFLSLLVWMCLSDWAPLLLILPVPLLWLLGASRGWLLRCCPLWSLCCFRRFLRCKVSAFSLWLSLSVISLVLIRCSVVGELSVQRTALCVAMAELANRDDFVIFVFFQQADVGNDS